MESNPTLRSAIDALCACFQENDRGLTHVVDLAVLVASADDRIDDAEMGALTRLLESIMGSALDRSVIRYFVNTSVKQIRSVGAEARARAIGELLAQQGAVDEGLRLAFAIAAASEGISSDERARIDLVARAAGASADRVSELGRMATSSSA